MTIFLPHRIYLIIICLFTFFCGSSTQASEGAWVSAEYLQTRLVADTGTKAPAKNEGFIAGLDVKLADGWHSYWRMPGDGGLPPELDTSESQNLKSLEIFWPSPKRFVTEGLNSFGYEGHFLLPIAVTPQDNTKDMILSVKANIMICRDICVPQKTALTLAIPAGKKPDNRTSQLIAKTLDKVPVKKDTPALSIHSVVLGPDAIAVSIYSTSGAEGLDLFVETGADFYITAKPAITPDKKEPRELMLRVPAPEGTDNLAKALEGKNVTFTLTSPRGAIERSFNF